MKGESITIVGGGIAGLSAAIYAKQIGVPFVYIFDADRKRPTDYHMYIVPRAVTLLNMIGISPSQIAKEIKDYHIIKGDRSVLNIKTDRSLYIVKRSTLLEVLKDRASMLGVSFNKILSLKYSFDANAIETIATLNESIIHQYQKLIIASGTGNRSIKQEFSLVDNDKNEISKKYLNRYGLITAKMDTTMGHQNKFGKALVVDFSSNIPGGYSFGYNGLKGSTYGARLIRDSISDLKTLHERFAKNESIITSKNYTPVGPVQSYLPNSNTMMAGSYGGYYNFLTGEGISYAIGSAIGSVESLIHGRKQLLRNIRQNCKWYYKVGLNFYSEKYDLKSKLFFSEERVSKFLNQFVLTDNLFCEHSSLKLLGILAHR